MKKSWFAILTACFLMACGESAPQQSTAAASSPSDNKPVYRVYSEQNYVPFIMHAMGQEPSGFEYDLLQAIGAKQGVKFTYTAHVWEDLFASLNRNDSDIISAGLTVTEERKKDMDFTDPHLESSPVILTKNKQIQSFADIAGKKVSIQSGTTHQQLVEQFQKGNGNIIKRDTAWLIVNEVMKNETDAAMLDSAVAQYYVKQYPNENLIVVADKSIAKEPLAFALKKGNQALKEQLNQGLAKIKADGTYDKIQQKWFGKQ
ncbi:substrate-binding periplasmic protein [Alysiella filiformis]|uniref:Polar amino acid transport system substrate-binding protein n=1 Tax=Alysiella filiformis DSM 16848 TaxID=1120981 RepID=A0A286E1R2_9NEIS|nr:transporter substrate-binding domain-containing protein [Alysiella filiformis]QMT30781.1 amino acid ABC transporter substrate-binding protein [Alysiella filiformis]UBQ56237.1 transporter substrate-binding domain-containing protein [Alysiella filiformis DSM 16848]SOD64831.1 polar amino acid transport system substrate-binding protein [Alysiella filiformis DSM 16848]